MKYYRAMLPYGAVLLVVACGGEDSGSTPNAMTGAGNAAAPPAANPTGGAVTPMGGAAGAPGGAAAGTAATPNTNPPVAGAGAGMQPQAGTGAAAAGGEGESGAGASADVGGADAGTGESGTGASAGVGGTGADAGASGAGGNAGTGASGMSGAGEGGAGGTPGGSTFSAVYQVIQASCGGGINGCHVTGNSGGLRMPNRATAYENLVGVASTECSGETRVVAGDADGSLLVKALEGTACVDRMPLRRDALSAADIALIRDWIDAGAMND